MTARFTTLQKVILLLLAAMTVIFALLTAVSRSRPGVSFEGALLRPVQEGEAAVYTGRVHGDPTTITVRPEGGGTEVVLAVEGRLRQRGLVEWPEGTIAGSSGLPYRRIQVSRNGTVIFRGGYNPAGGAARFCGEDGSWEPLVSVRAYAQHDPWSGYTFDAPDILRFALEPEPAVRGSWEMWGLGLLLSVLCGLQTAFPLAFFYLRHALAVEDPEPTEFYLFMQRAGSVVAAAAVFGLYLYGLTLQTPL